MDGRQADIPSRHAVVPDLFQMIQEVTNRFGGQVFQGQAVASLPMMMAGNSSNSFIASR